MTRTQRPTVRRASVAAAALVAGSLIAAPVSSAQADAVLPTCTLSLSGVPLVGQQLTSVLTVNAGADLLALDLPVAQAVVSVPTGSATPALPGTLSPLTSLPYTVLPSDVGKDVVAVGQIRSVLAGSPLALVLAGLGIDLSSPIVCTPARTPVVPPGEPPVWVPPVVAPPGVPATTLGPTPVSSTPRVVGATKRGKTVRADLGTLPAGVSVTYQWFTTRKQHAAQPAAGATGPTYRLKRGLRGKRVSVVVTYSKAGCTPTVLGSPSRRVR